MSDIARQMRSARQLWAQPGSRHDKLIGTLRIVLPIMIGVLAAFLVMAPLTAGSEISFVLDKNKVEVAKERMRIERAVYRGQDDKGQPFDLTAGSAVQRSSAEKVVLINEMVARLQLSDGPAQVAAPQARFDMTTQQVNVPGEVKVRSAGGYRLDTSNATLDLNTRRITSGGGVTGTTPQGTFSGDAMIADIENRDVKLTGNARLRIVPHRAR